MKLHEITYQKQPCEVTIVKARITGIKRPEFRTELRNMANTDEFFIFSDDELCDTAVDMLPGKGHVLVRAVLQPNAKKAVLLLKKDAYCLLTEKNNVFLLRLLHKVTDTLMQILRKIKGGFMKFVRKLRKLWRMHHFMLPIAVCKEYYKKLKRRIHPEGTYLFDVSDQANYIKWLKTHEHFHEVKPLSYNPKISLLIPVYNIGREFLSDCLDSILCQTYTNFEICLVDDCSTNQETIDTLHDYMRKDKRVRVKFRSENGHISAATNDALAMAEGEFVGLVDNDDILAKEALYENVLYLNEHPDTDMIYSDEDKIDTNGKRCQPHFKPDFSPDSFLSSNYICHFTILRKSIMDEIQGFTLGVEGAQDYDLFLRFSEKAKKIAHLPMMLYHWRMVEGSTSMVIDNKGYALERGRQSVENALQRRGIKGHVEIDEPSKYYKVVYEYEKEPSISIIIPTRDHADVTRTCLKSIFEKTDYHNFEVILVNNNSEKKETFQLFEEYKTKYKNFRVLDANIEFNYSKLNNLAAKDSKSDFLLLLNNDTEVIQKDWLSIMVGYASQAHIGAVGVKLLYPDMTVQHAGVILGKGVAYHVSLFCDRNDHGLYGRLRVPYDYSAVTAACLMVSRKKYEEAQGLEEDLKVAYNDIDFNLKLLKLGYFNVCLPQVELMHYESKSRGSDTTPQNQERFLKEMNYMKTKWSEELKHDRFYNPNFSDTPSFKLEDEVKKKKMEAASK